MFKTMTKLVAVTALAALAAVPVIPDAQAAPPLGDGTLDTNALLSCEIAAYEWIPQPNEWGVLVPTPFPLEDEDTVGNFPVTVHMLVHNYGPEDAIGLETDYLVATSRTSSLLDLSETEDVIDGDAAFETLYITPAQMNGVSRINIRVDTDLGDMFSPFSGIPIESCDMQLNVN